MSGAIEFGGEVTPQESWNALSHNPKAALIDVRTEAEFVFVGRPDLSSLGKDLWFIPWKVYPGMSINSEFVDEVASRIDENGIDELFFICRSGARSLDAAQAMTGRPTARGVVRVVNVAEGFEGDLDAERHRGRVNGWKKSGLPWAQS